jgi:hypothetical protein
MLVMSKTRSAERLRLFVNEFFDRVLLGRS